MLNMDAMTGRFGLVVRRDGTDLDHNLRTVVIDTEGKVRRIFVGNEWTPDDLVREIVRAARAGKRG
jgi:protein SCO1/2